MSYSKYLVASVVAVALFVVLAAGAWFFISLREGTEPSVWNDSQESEKALEAGLEATKKGNFADQRASFEEGMRLAVSPEEKSYYETLLATSYEQEDFKQAAYIYLGIINNREYPAHMKGLAAAYLMRGLDVYRRDDYAQYVFSQKPFMGYMDQNAENWNAALGMALAKGNEWSVRTHPNFIAHLWLAHFYARNYFGMTAAQRIVYGPRILAYFNLGKEELEKAQSDVTWSAGLVSNGAIAEALAAERIYVLQQQYSIEKGGQAKLSYADVDAAYKKAVVYADERAHLQNAAIAANAVYGRLYYARFLNEQKESQDLNGELLQIAVSLERIMSRDPQRFTFLADLVSKAESSKQALIALARLHTPLRTLLVERVGALTTNDLK